VVCGFALAPIGFFDQNPVIDLPSQTNEASSCAPLRMMSHAVVSEAGVRLSARRGFETLGDAARGLEALLIVEAGGARIPRDHPALGRARSDLAEAEAVIRAGRTTPPAAHPHRHLVPSAGRLGAASVSMSKRRNIAARQTLAPCARLETA
jgi:hypothetical protein